MNNRNLFYIKKKTVSDKIFYLSVEANEKLAKMIGKGGGIIDNALDMGKAQRKILFSEYQQKLPCTQKENQTQRKVVLIYNTYSQSDTGRSCKFGGDSVFQPAGSRLLDNSTSLCCIHLFSGC